MNENNSKRQTVAVLGASETPERYSHRAVLELLKHGHEVVPVHPTTAEICGIKVEARLDKIEKEIDTLTLYVNPVHLAEVESQIVTLNPKRIIFNPGTEDREIMQRLSQKKIEIVQACTLVMLATGQF